jgi:membrane protease YdiL (CAAX protease family)
LSEVKSPMQQGWLRALLFFLVFMLSYMSVAWLLQRKSGDTTMGDRIAQQLQLAHLAYTGLLLFFILAIALTWLFRKFIDRGTLASMGFQWAGHQRDAWLGFFLGPALLGTGSLILYLNDNLSWMDINFNQQEFFTALAFMLLVAVGEELVFRGYILHNLLQSVNRWFALGASAMAFTVAHSSNPAIDVIAFINLFVAGLLLGINYLYTRNLCFAIFFHFSWNFFQGPVLGFDVSGINLQSLFEAELKGNSLLTGGAFGFEGSILAGILCIIALLLLHVIYEKGRVTKQATN